MSEKFYSPTKKTNRMTTRSAVTYSDADGGAFLTAVINSKKTGHAVMARRSKRNPSTPQPAGRLSDISTSTLYSPSPGKTHRPVARSTTKTPSSAAKKKQAKKVTPDDDMDHLVDLFSTKVKVTDSLVAETMDSKRLSQMPKDGRYTDLVQTKTAGPFSPVRRSTRIRSRND